MRIINNMGDTIRYTAEKFSSGGMWEVWAKNRITSNSYSEISEADVGPETRVRVTILHHDESVTLGLTYYGYANSTFDLSATVSGPLLS